jgi:hypothetical protein
LNGAVAPFKQLYEWYGDRVRFLDIFIRQAHPGELRGPYRSYEEKLNEAGEYKREEGIEWPVLVDDYEGTVHRTYSGEMADPSLLIDSEGRIAFYCMWTHPPTLKKALDELLERGGRGVVASGIDRTPHLLASFVNGYHGLKRGGKRALREYNITTLGGSTLSLLGSRAKPLLAPVALRATPLPVSAKLALLGGSAAAALGVWSLFRD